MSDLTNTPKREPREPAYGKNAERYSKEQRLGAAVIGLLAPNMMGERVPSDRAGGVADRIVEAARELGLLDSPKAEPKPIAMRLVDGEGADRATLLAHVRVLAARPCIAPAPGISDNCGWCDSCEARTTIAALITGGRS